MAKPRPLLDRLLNTPDLEKIVPRLQPEVLHRVIQTCGLEDCAEFVALATSGQIARILDLDVWRVRAAGSAGSAGIDEAFDADRFGVWLAVLMESGAAVATEKLIGLDLDLVVAGLARHAAVFDQAAVSSYTTLDGEDVPGRAKNRGPVSEIGGYVIERRRTSAWDTIVDLLAFLEAEHREYFHRMMRGCVRMSNGAREEDGCHDLLDDDEQHIFDLASDRERRREQQGYLTPAQAHAFLRGGSDLQLDADRPPRSAIARAYFRAIEPTSVLDAETPRESKDALPESSADPSPRPEIAQGPDTGCQAPVHLDAVSGFVEVLFEAGVLTPPARALPAAADPEISRLSRIEAHVASCPASGEELAYLANAVIAGCSIQGRPFTAREASEGAAAVCNLGLENWPSPWADGDLITAFQVGWTVLHRDVCMYTANQLIDVVATIRCRDRDIHLRLHALRRDLIQHVGNREPWRARNALDVLIMLDAPSWAALLGLIDECPVMHAAVRASRQPRRAIDPTEFEFISENSQIAAVREFMASLPSVLTG